MGRINVKGVIVGGLVAGLVLNIIDFLVWGVLLKADMEAVMQTAGKGPIDNLIPLFVILDFIYGIVLVYLYAAIRPRFGAGPGTAVKAGLLVWILIGLLHALSEGPMGMLPQRLYIIGTLVALVQFPLAAVAGAKFYREV
jgi:hypothetical protein